MEEQEIYLHKGKVRIPNNEKLATCYPPLFFPPEVIKILKERITFLKIEKAQMASDVQPQQAQEWD